MIHLFDIIYDLSFGIKTYNYLLKLKMICRIVLSNIDFIVKAVVRQRTKGVIVKPTLAGSIPTRGNEIYNLI